MRKRHKTICEREDKKTRKKNMAREGKVEKIKKKRMEKIKKERKLR